ncbi:MFS transporter, partial [Mesorhizobium sp. M7A.F.Ca.ET.027.03.2.1]
SLMWGVGGIAVPPLAGGAMDVMGARGLPITLGLMCLALAIASLAGGRKASIVR